MEPIDTRLKDKRQNKGWTQLEMSVYLNTSIKNVQNWEQRRRPTPVWVLDRIGKLRIGG